MNELKWINLRELTKPGLYFVCWKGGDNKYYNLRAREIYSEFVDAITHDAPESNMYYYGPLEIPPPPTGDVWGV